MSQSSYPAGFRGGAIIKNVPLHDQIDGNVFWVNSNGGGAGNSGKFTSPMKTVQQGIDKTLAGNNDIVFVAPLHAETLTASINFNKASTSVIGMGVGGQRPTLTGDGTIDVVDVSAASMTLANFNFAAPLTTAQTSDVNVDAAFFRLINTRHLGSVATETKVSFVTITANGDNLLIDGLRGHNVVVDMTSGIHLEGLSDSVEIKNVAIQSNGSIGFSVAVLDDSAACTNVWVHDCIFNQMKVTLASVDFASNSEGACSNMYVSGRHATLASNLLLGNAMDFYETYVTESAAANGLIIPVIDT